ncbi:hypothetical protein ACW9I8_11375 [Pseudomonas reactans]
MQIGAPEYSYFAISIYLMVGLLCLHSVINIFKTFNTNIYDKKIASWFFVFISILITIQFFVQILPPFKPYAYADDWMYAGPLSFSSTSQWIDWVFAQHVDHRIPIQKITNFFILEAFEFDFRSVVGLNVLLALASSIMLLNAAKTYRGRQSIGDLIIPLGLLHFSSGYTLWGFQFQFLSSIFFVSCFIFFATKFAHNKKTPQIVLAALSLVACSLCGVNGMLFSTVITTGMVAWLFLNNNDSPIAKRSFSVVLLLEATLWLKWNPTAASSTDGLNLPEFFTYFYNLMPSSMGVYAFDGTSWKACVIIILFLLSVFYCALSLLKKSLNLNDVILILAAAASFVVMLSVAVGRSKIQGPWNNGVAMHYGSMSLFIPLACWMIISKRLPTRATIALGLVLTGIYLLAYMKNLEWRENVILQASAHQEEVIKALQSGVPPEVIVEKYFSDLSVGDENRGNVATGINLFRAAGSPLYGR